MRKEIVITGSGRQGIQGFGSLLSKTLDHEGHLVSFSINYDMESRCGKFCSNIVIKDSPEDWPEILEINILVALSQEGYNSCLDKMSSDAVIIYDSDTVKPELSKIKHYPVPATKTAVFAGSTTMVNMIMLGAMAAITGICSLSDFSQTLHDKTSLSAPDKRMEYIKDGYNLCACQGDMEIAPSGQGINAGTFLNSILPYLEARST